MAKKTKIEWTCSTWNPVTGCTKVSAACEHCYAERMALRLHGMGVKKYVNAFRVTTHPDTLKIPLGFKKPRIIFTNSMGDLFHPDVPTLFIKRVFSVMTKCPQHVFQVLTKRSPRLRGLSPRLPWPDNIWMGVTVERKDYLHRIDDLCTTGAYIKWLSCEPLLGPLNDMNLSDIDWIVVGGESGPGARPMEEEWVIDIKRQCDEHDVAFCFKQWGGVNKKKTGRTLRGRIYDAMPSCPQFESAQAELF